MTSELDSNELQAEAFKRLYPDQYFDKFFSAGIRPDGRPLGRARPVTVGPGTITVSDGSALVKVGSSTALCGIKVDLSRPAEATPDQGQVTVSVEYAPFSVPDFRPGKAPEETSTITNRLQGLLLSSNHILDKRVLLIGGSKNCWNLTVNAYILDADGSTFDVVLLSVVAALMDVRLPPVVITSEGYAKRQHQESEHSQGQRLQLTSIPISLTCCLYKNYLMVDPSREEEQVAHGTITTVLDGQGHLLGVYKYGGKAMADMDMSMKCIEAAKQRYKDVREQLDYCLGST